MNAQTPRLTVSAPERLEEAFHGASLGEFEPDSPYAACLKPLLITVGWTGDTREIIEALPHFANSLELTGLRNVMATLGYKTHPKHLRLADLDERVVPCLFVPDLRVPGFDQADWPRGPLAILGCQAGHWRVYDSARAAERHIEAGEIAGTAYMLAKSADEEDAGAQGSWIKDLVYRFRPLLLKALTASFLLNLLALATPLFVMTIYDKVIGYDAAGLLVPLLLGMLLVVGVEAALRFIRAQAIAYAGARTDSLVGAAALQRVLFLPPSQVEGAPVSAQASRLKDFERIRDFFTGPLATVALELPFTVILLAAIAVLSGIIVLVPVVLLIAFGIAGAVLFPRLKDQTAKASKARSERHRFNIEAFSNLRTIKELGAENIWFNRYRELSANSAMSAFALAQHTALLQSIAHLFMTSAGIATLVIGANLVIAEKLTVGALVATMALVWRVLSPLQQGFVALSRLEQAKQSGRQIDTLMNLKTEFTSASETSTIRNFAGRIRFAGVSHRYGPAADPALVGVSFDIAPREFVGITGRNSSGKSTILKLIAGMHPPQVGKVEIDGLNIRQIDSARLREAIAYVPQTCQLFHGTIAQNLRLSHPVATQCELEEACRLAGIADDIDNLADGLETRIGDQRSARLTAGFLQRLALARAYLKDAPILLLDEPAQALDQARDWSLTEALKQLRGTRTIAMVSHRPSHLKMADRVLVLADGKLLADAPPAPQVESPRARLRQ